MKLHDIFEFSLHALQGYLSRTLLTLLAMSIGVASVVLLTSLGEGARLYVSQQFSSLGSNLLIVLPGRTETTGTAPPLLGGTTRDLTLADAQALLQSRHISKVAPIIVGSAPVSFASLEREVTILGSTASLYEVRNLKMAQGRFLPAMEWQLASQVCVIGAGLKNELFGAKRALGQWLRVSADRCRVIGVLAREGMSIGVDMSDILIMPVTSARRLFNATSLFRILAEAENKSVIEKARLEIENIIRERHEGEADVTVLSQDALLKTFNKILSTLTYSLGAIAAISLLVAGIMIMNVMLVAVSQRTREIGLLKALGAGNHQIILLFVTESAFLSISGAVLGLLAGLGINMFLQTLFPEFPFVAPSWALWSALSLAMLTGIGFGLVPAGRAAKLDPVTALSGR